LDAELWMQAALHQARLAEEKGEVPVGAVLVHQGEIIASGFNETILSCDPSAHAEIIAIRKAAAFCKNHRLIDTTLVVTLEPCAMCAGAMIQARVGKVIFGASDPRAGAAGSVFQVLQNGAQNHRVEIVSGILATTCRDMLQDFFKAKRSR